tara:strand:+ start:258 stop:1139 length:882 start_codon:yes stop_codon:yes gene_type:complete
VAFINKKEEVIKLRLTQEGKNLLSRGKFKPECYAFFDDDIIYDSRYAGVTEHQNTSITRITEQPRRDVQHLTTPIESRYRTENEQIELNDTQAGSSEELANLMPGREYDNLVYPFQEKRGQEKILGFPLMNMELGTQFTPRFELQVFESEIENSSSLRYDNLDGCRAKIPQLDFEPEHVLIRDTMAVNPFAEQGELVDSESFEVNPIGDKIEFMDGSFFEHKPESVKILLEEFNVKYLTKNFDIEVYEIIEENSATDNSALKKVENWRELFSIQIDDSVDSIPNKNNQRKGFF